MDNTKTVYFGQYRKSCKYRKLNDSKDPCNTCLANPTNTDSHLPLSYESKDNSLCRKRGSD